MTSAHLSIVFQSTLSARRATLQGFLKSLNLLISIHALREESDLTLTGCGESWENFNPRSPRGERLSIIDGKISKNIISIHALREESDWSRFA